jgi:hypothetical protein
LPQSTTLNQILRDIAERLGGTPATGTTTALGSTTTAVDGIRLAYADADADALGNPVLRIDELVGGGPAAGEYATVRDGGLTPATGAVLLSPALSLPIQSGTDYSLWRDVHPDAAQKALNRVLREMDREVLVPVSVFADGDMEDAGVTAYTAIGGVGLSKGTTAIDVRHGAQCMQVTGGGAGQGPRTAAPYRATTGEIYIVSAAIRVSSSAIGAELRLLDADTLALLASAGHQEKAYQEIDLPPVSIPAGTEQIFVEILSTLGAGNYRLDDIVVWPQSKNNFELPSWAVDPGDIIDLGYWPRGRALAGSQVFMLDETPWTSWPWWPKRGVYDEGAHPLVIEFGTPVPRPLFLRIRRKYDELATAASTTSVDRKLVVDCALREIFRDLELEAIRGNQTGQANLWAREANKLEELASVRAFLSRRSAVRAKVTTPRRRQLYR